jgi:hypothetical protein
MLTLRMHPPAPRLRVVFQPACSAMYNTASTCFMAASGVDVEMWDARSGAPQNTFTPVEQMIRMTKELNQVREWGLSLVQGMGTSCEQQLSSTY